MSDVLRGTHMPNDLFCAIHVPCKNVPTHTARYLQENLMKVLEKTAGLHCFGIGLNFKASPESRISANEYSFDVFVWGSMEDLQFVAGKLVSAICSAQLAVGAFTGSYSTNVDLEFHTCFSQYSNSIQALRESMDGLREQAKESGSRELRKLLEVFAFWCNRMNYTHPM